MLQVLLISWNALVQGDCPVAQFEKTMLQLCYNYATA